MGGALAIRALDPALVHGCTTRAAFGFFLLGWSSDVGSHECYVAEAK
jgi:hypothetical protein